MDVENLVDWTITCEEDFEDLYKDLQVECTVNSKELSSKNTEKMDTSFEHLFDDNVDDNELANIKIAIPTRDEKAAYIKDQKNARTVIKTQSSIKQFKEFLAQKNEYQEVESLNKECLNNHLEDFFMILRKKSGDEYEPNSIRCIYAGINRYLQEKKYPANLTNDTAFQGTRDMLTAKFKVISISPISRLHKARFHTNRYRFINL